MDRTPITSKSLASAGYDPATQTLEIEFTSGSVYQYFKVPERVYSEFIHAASHGQYFLANIKESYEYRRVSKTQG